MVHKVGDREILKFSVSLNIASCIRTHNGPRKGEGPNIQAPTTEPHFKADPETRLHNLTYRFIG